MGKTNRGKVTTMVVFRLKGYISTGARFVVKLGVSSSTASGAAIYIKLGLFFSFLGIIEQSLFAFPGIILLVVLVYGITKIKKGLCGSMDSLPSEA